MYETDLDNAFKNYFKTREDLQGQSSEESIVPQYEDTHEYIRMSSEENISDLDKFGELLRKLLNAAWGSDWGAITPEFPEGDDAENITLPMITYDIVSRETSENLGKLKPTLIDTIDEIVDGKPTGDVFQIYGQWFDCIVEFDIWGKNTLEARNLLNRFELAMAFYTGLLKEQGVSEILFLKEIPAKQSIHYIDNHYMKVVLYLIRLERRQIVRQSTLKNIEIIFKEQTTGQNPDDIYKNTNMTYDLIL
jgi:hypothetical protein